MNAQRPRWSRTAKIGVGLVVLAALLGFAYRYQAAIKPAIKEARRDARVLLTGRQEYLSGVIASNMAKTGGGAPVASTLETAVLPLRVEKIRISDFVPFPLGAGSATAVGEHLVVMDRFGKFYRLDGDTVRALALPALPNDLEGFVTRSRSTNLSSDTFRTHSIAFRKQDGRLYASYEKYVDRSHNRFEIAALRLDPVSLAPSGEWQVVFSSPVFGAETFGLAGGGKLLAAGEKLLFSVGDYGFYGPKEQPGKHAAQDLGVPYGKIFELQPDGKARMISYGHRNTQGLVVTRAGQLINVEQGPQGGDELNIIHEGRNYGWPVETYGTDYGKYTWPYQPDRPERRFELPLYAFVPSVAADTLVQLDQFHPRWDGDLLVGSLKAQTMYRVRLSGDRVVLVEPIFFGHRMREIVPMGHAIVVYTDDGYLVRVTADADAVARDARSVDTVSAGAFAKCLSCHHTGITNPTHLAPSLASVMGRRIASDNFGRYSAALKQKGGVWDKERLRAFVSDPATFAPGTAMPKVDLSEAELAEVVDYLASH